MKIKFFLTPYYIPDNYSPESIALAEGFDELGIDFFANINYWYESKDNRYLFREDNVQEYDIAIYDYKYLYHSIDFTIYRVDRTKINILIDRNDWLRAKWRDPLIYDKFDIILLDHMLKGFKYPAKVRPWAIGFTNRVKEYVDKYRDEKITLSKNKILSNFRVGHNVRSLLTNKLNIRLNNFTIYNKTTDESDIVLSDVDILYQEATANRHHPLYYQELNESILTYAFGGYYEYKPHLYQPYNIWQKIIRKPFYYYHKLLDKMGMDISSSIFIFQFDSFRFWEVLYSNSCPIHLDFEDWGFILPQMPIEGKHYLGIKRLDIDEFSKRIGDMTDEEIYQISLDGARWVDDYYSPKAVANRLIGYIKEL